MGENRGQQIEAGVHENDAAVAESGSEERVRDSADEHAQPSGEVVGGHRVALLRKRDHGGHHRCERDESSERNALDASQEKGNPERARCEPRYPVQQCLDGKDKNGPSYRPIFERFIDQRLMHFEHKHDVAGEMTLEAGDLEQFICESGKTLGAEVTQLKIERERERSPGR